MNAAKDNNRPPIQYTDASPEHRDCVPGPTVDVVKPISRKGLRKLGSTKNSDALRAALRKLSI
jgi:hypothetical protein